MGSSLLNRRLYDWTPQTCGSLTLKRNSEVTRVQKTVDETRQVKTHISAQHDHSKNNGLNSCKAN